jgi:hypothetical protein
MRIAGEIAYQFISRRLKCSSGDTSKRKQLAPKRKAARFNPFHETLIKLPLAHSQHGSVSAAN